MVFSALCLTTLTRRYDADLFCVSLVQFCSCLCERNEKGKVTCEPLGEVTRVGCTEPHFNVIQYTVFKLTVFITCLL